MKQYTARKIIAVMALIFTCQHAWADIVINGTRVIYNEKEKEINVRLTNEGTRPLLVKSWLDKGIAEESPENIDVPFVINPPVSRIDSKKGQVLRISKLANALPKDRESIFYLNVLEVPPKMKASEKNAPEAGNDAASSSRLQLAFRTRIKFFWRPANLANQSVAEASRALKWQVVNAPKGWAVKVTNNTPYYFSFSKISAAGQPVKASMVAPMSTGEFPAVNSTPKPGNGKVEFSWINDYGTDVDDSALSGQ